MAIEVTDPSPAEGAGTILTPEALAFIEELHHRFAPTRNDLLAARIEAPRGNCCGGIPGFPARDRGYPGRGLDRLPRLRPRSRTGAWK